MENLTTHFEQIPVAVVKKIAILDVPATTSELDHEADTVKPKPFVVRTAGGRKS